VAGPGLNFRRGAWGYKVKKWAKPNVRHRGPTVIGGKSPPPGSATEITSYNFRGPNFLS